MAGLDPGGKGSMHKLYTWLKLGIGMPGVWAAYAGPFGSAIAASGR